MKVTCERCAAQYDVDESRIGPAGIQIKCPACMHLFTVTRSPAAAGAVSGAGLDLAPEPEGLDLPAPVNQGRGTGTIFGLPPPPPLGGPGPSLDDGLDLPAPVFGGAGPSLPPPPDLSGAGLDLPAPVGPSSGLPDLPAPVVGGPGGAFPPPPAFDSPVGLDLPAPVGPAPSAGGLDLPAPVGPAPSAGGLDLPAPVGPAGGASMDEGIGLDLDAPEADDLASSASSAIPLETVDLPAPKAETMEVAPRGGSTVIGLGPLGAAPTSSRPPPIPTIEPDLVEDEGLSAMLDEDTGGVSPAAAAVPAAGPAVPQAYETGAPPAVAATAPTLTEAPARARRRPRWMVPAIAAGATAIVVAIVVAIGMGGLGKKHDPRLEAKLQAARKLMAEDTLASYKKAAAELEGLQGDSGLPLEAAALAAQAHLGAARLGSASDVAKADALIETAEKDDKAATSRDLEHARALRPLLSGKPAEARAKLGALLAQAPSDAVALVYLGWTELQAGDYAAADRAFTKAVTAESTRAQALWGAAYAKHRLGERDAARELFGRAIARNPEHFGAKLGVALVESQDPVEVRTRVEDLIARNGQKVGTRELAEAWVTLGLNAEAAGRRDEAEDRLRRAVQLDQGSSFARVALARVLCDSNKCTEGLTLAKKVAAEEPQSLDAQLVLVQALIETERAEDARDPMQAAMKVAPKAPRVLYWQGRLALAQEKPDRDEALARFKDAIAGDGHFTQAYLALSQTYAQMGKPDDGMAVLKDAEAKAVDDPEFQARLGDAYLLLSKPVEAEARFRVALAKAPEANGPRLSLGLAFEMQNKLDEAARAYDDLAVRAPNYPGLAERQARLTARQGRIKEAEPMFDAALGQGMPTRSLRLEAASVKLELGKYDEARKLAETVAREDERSALAQLLIARSEYELKRLDEALMAGRRAATLGDLPEAHLVLGRVLEQMGKLEPAVSEYQAALRPPVESEAALGRARIFVRTGASDAALKEIGPLLKNPAYRAEAKMIEGDCSESLRQMDQARRAYEEAVKMKPELGEAWFKLGRLLKDAGRRGPATDALNKAVELSGARTAWAAEAALLLGDAHSEVRKNDAAVKMYRRYLELAPKDSPSRKEVERKISILGG